MSEIKPGDHVFVGRWEAVRDDGEGYWILDGGDGTALGAPTLVASEVAIIPSHPRAKAVLTWLNATPNAAQALRHLVWHLDGYKAPEQVGSAVWDVAPVLRSLLAALEG